MPGVTKNIKTYFKPVNSPLKRKSDVSQTTPDQKKRMAQNRFASKIILESKNFPILDREMGSSWFEALELHFKKDSFKRLNDFIVKEREGSKKIFPKEENVWSWTKFFPISETKVVILGQDPYHGPSQAHGLCFSVLPGIRPPPSLLNMFKELEQDIPDFKRPNHGYLSGWASQGVLLLNAVLTVRQAEANSHKDKGWEQLTDAVIQYISDNCDGVVFLLWGSHAQKKGGIVNKNKHHLLKSVHPSPLSAHRGFLGCKHFSKANEILKEQGKVPIDWTHLPQDI
ncbi:uracil-DNA glycosylase [Lepeophtheirus salmonis]|uniref:uracil-DNA glycosylase n=1 Tax=Lepeophtheirus salmonis TaxID=72036 RepID=UPI001AE74437|nr:uracil-DNA glycosylase-like [Lepeophtheirus salmonis]